MAKETSLHFESAYKRDHLDRIISLHVALCLGRQILRGKLGPLRSVADLRSNEVSRLPLDHWVMRTESKGLLLFVQQALLCPLSLCLHAPPPLPPYLYSYATLLSSSCYPLQPCFPFIMTFTKILTTVNRALAFCLHIWSLFAPNLPINNTLCWRTLYRWRTLYHCHPRQRTCDLDSELVSL